MNWVYKAIFITEDERNILQFDDGIIEFCLRKGTNISILSTVALLICLIPASYAYNERDFSHLKHIVGNLRSSLNDECIEAFAYAHNELRDSQEKSEIVQAVLKSIRNT